MKTVIAAVDFSSNTNRVALAALKLGRLLKGKVLFLHVVPPPAAIRDVLPAVEDVELRTLSTGHDADKKLAELKHTFQRKFRPIECKRSVGVAVATIVDEARNAGAEYIVLGSHGHSAVYDALLGSVATGVARKAPCPVLVIPPLVPAAEPMGKTKLEPATA